MKFPRPCRLLLIKNKMGNFEGPKIIGKIDLSAFQKKAEQKLVFHPEKYLPKLENILETQSCEINEEFPDFLDKEAKIKIIGESAEKDQKEVLEIEEYFARDRQQSLDIWREEKKKHPATLAEMAVTAVLHKFIGQDFIVARATDYDDYKNGVDNILIDKKTGAVICGFDEVLGAVGDGGIEMKEKMIAKSRKKAERKRTGAHLRYGATIDSGVLTRKSLNNLPTFFLSLSREELMLLLEDIEKNQSNGGEYERKMFDKFISLIENQAQQNEEKEIDPILREKLLSTKKIISELNQ